MERRSIGNHACGVNDEGRAALDSGNGAMLSTLHTRHINGIIVSHVTAKPTREARYRDASTAGVLRLFLHRLS
eukprot:1139197-Pelagomonas_calceolata.AAC.9